MQTKTSILEASKTNTRDLVNSAKAINPDSKLSLDKSGSVLVDGQPNPEINNLARLIAQLGEAQGKDLGLIAIREFTKNEPEDSKVICIVWENLNGNKKVLTQQGSKPLDDLSKKLVEIGGVYLGTMNRSGFALVDPENEIELARATELNTHFGGIHPIIFDAVWQRIRDREQQETLNEAEAKIEGDYNTLLDQGSITLGAMG